MVKKYLFGYYFPSCFRFWPSYLLLRKMLCVMPHIKQVFISVFQGRDFRWLAYVDEPIDRKLLLWLDGFWLGFFVLFCCFFCGGRGSVNPDICWCKNWCKATFIKNYLKNLKYNVPNMHVFFIYGGMGGGVEGRKGVT